jgi:hypothetical protein
VVGLAEIQPRIKVSKSEYMKEVRKFREYKRLIGRPVVPGKVGVLWSRWGRALSLWHWTKRPEYLEEARRLRSEIARLKREERGARAIFRKKIVHPYWRIDVAYQFEEETTKPPYRFYLEVRKYVYTLHPERYAVWNEKTMEYEIRPDVLKEFEGELRLILFATSRLSRVKKDGGIAHLAWVEALIERKVYPFPNVEIAAVDESEVEGKLDEQNYYFRVDETGAAPKAEYGTREVAEWLRSLYEWIGRMHRAGRIRYPEAFINAIKRTSLDDYVKRFRE